VIFVKRKKFVLERVCEGLKGQQKYVCSEFTFLHIFRTSMQDVF